VTAVSSNNLGYSHYAYTVKFDDGSTVALILQQDLNPAPTARYRTGEVVALTTGALNELNGTSLKDHQNWIGTVTAVTPKTYANSKFVYNVTFKSGTGTVVHSTVLEQDLKTPSQGGFGVGSRVQVADTALNATDGASLVAKQYKIGTVTSLIINNAGHSQYAYTVKFDDGTVQANILEQDLWRAPAAAKFTVGQQVQLNNGALDALNGTNLRDKKQWIGVVKAVSPKRYANSSWMYSIVYTNGTKTVQVDTILEQDLQVPTGAGLTVGARVRVVSTANASATGQSIIDQVGKYGIVTKVSVNNLGDSHYAYDVKFDNGQTVTTILQQDLAK
jgi:Fe-S cluster assembly iron-binding protein IscA